MTLRDLLLTVQNAILSRPLRVLGISAGLVVVAVFLGLQVEFRTSRSELAPPDDPDQRRWSALLEDYGGSEALIACVEPDDNTDFDPARLARIADRLAQRFRSDSSVDHVFHRMDLSFFERYGLHLAPTESLDALGQALGQESEWLDRLGSVTDLAQFNELLALRLERGFAEGGAVPEDGEVVLRRLADLLRAQHQFLVSPEATVNGWTRKQSLLELAGEQARELGDGYLSTHDGRTLFLIITPRRSDDDLEFRRGFVGAMRDHARAVIAEERGYRVGFTGQPALVVDEMDTVRSDTRRTSVFAALGVALLTLLVFRWKSHSLLVLLALAAGVIWAYGAVRLELGYLNMITSSFISTLIGVGVAYGIHPVSEYELAGAHTGDPVEAVRTAFHRTGAGVAVAALTTSAAFFSVQLMRFRGFSELGIVAGFGVLLCFLAAAVTLPALLVVYATWRKRRDPRPARDGSAMDQIWGGVLVRSVCRFPRTVTLGALIVTVVMGWAASGLEFSTDIMDLLPRNAESLRYQRRMLFDSDLSPFYNIVVADDLEQLRAMRHRAAKEPSIRRFVSIADLLPATSNSGAALEPIQGALNRIRLPQQSTPLEAGSLARSHARLEEALDLATEAAFTAGLAELVEPLELARVEAERCGKLARDAGSDQVAAWNLGQERTLEWGREMFRRLRSAAGEKPPGLDDIPAEMQRRFLTRSGKLMGFLYPSSSVFDSEELATYVTASRRVAVDVTGFPLVFHKMAGRITQGFYRAVATGAILVVLILLIDYRNPRDAVLAIVPLVMGVIWMMGAMRILGIAFNFANLVAVPLIIGVGIDNGVHVVHRVKLEGRKGIGVVLRHTGRAILIASLTTMVGFGSLSLASHRGLSSLGLVLLLGVGACLITSTVVLPNLVLVLGLAERGEVDVG